MLRAMQARRSAIREFHPRFHRCHGTLTFFAAHLKHQRRAASPSTESGFQSWARLKKHIEKPQRTDQLELAAP